MTTLHPQPVRTDRNLASRLAALEDKLERSNTINRIPIAETMKRRKEELEKDTFTALEESYQTQINKQFDLTSKNNNQFVNICKFTVEFIATNALTIGKLLGYTIAGSVKMDMALSLLQTLFLDISKEVLQNVVQHTFDLTYTIDKSDTKTIMGIENKINEIGLTNMPHPGSSGGPEGPEGPGDVKKRSKKWWRFWKR